MDHRAAADVGPAGPVQIRRGIHDHGLPQLFDAEPILASAMLASGPPFIHPQRMTETVATSIATTALRLRVDELSQALIPAELGHLLGVVPGEFVVARVQDGQLTIQTPRSREEEV